MAAAVDCFTSLDFADGDHAPAREKVKEGIERLIRATVAHHPCAFFAYREPQVYRPEYIAAQKKLAHHFYDQLCPLLEEARRDGDLDFSETKITALAALQPARLPLQLVPARRPPLARRSGAPSCRSSHGACWACAAQRLSTAHPHPIPHSYGDSA